MIKQSLMMFQKQLFMCLLMALLKSGKSHLFNNTSGISDYVLLRFIRSTNANKALKKRANPLSKEMSESSSNQVMPTNADFLDYISESCKVASSSYGVFKKKAADQVIFVLDFLFMLVYFEMLFFAASFCTSFPPRIFWL